MKSLKDKKTLLGFLSQKFVEMTCLKKRKEKKRRRKNRKKKREKEKKRKNKEGH